MGFAKDCLLIRERDLPGASGPASGFANACFFAVMGKLIGSRR